MRPVDNETRQTMNTRRNFVNYAHMVLSDGTELNLTPSDFRISGNNFTDDFTDGESFPIGTAIGKTATMLLDNTDGRTEDIGSSTVTYPHGKFSDYDFYMAYFELYVCLPDAYHYAGELRDQMIPIGTFTVTTPTSHGATIEIVGVDNMYLFDRSFDECDLDFSTNPTLITVLNKCCTDCGVAIGYTSFTNQNLTVRIRPEDATYRQVVTYIAQIAGCNAKITETGALTLVSYDMSSLLGLDGGSFLTSDDEFVYMNKFTWSSGASTGYNIFYDRVPRTGRYKITKVVIEDIDTPSTFDGYFEVSRANSFRDSVNNGTEFSSANGRQNWATLQHIDLVEGENIVDYDIEVTALNRINYWCGIGSTSGTGSKFSATVYMKPISFVDGDSADGGTFEPEWPRGLVQHWNKDSGGEVHDNIRWYYTHYRCPDNLGPAGKYTVTRIYIDNIADPSHFNGLYEIHKSIDSGTNWTVEESGTLVAGDNVINFDMTLNATSSTRYRVQIGQNIVTDTDASSFDARQYFKANDDLYLDGDNFSGGDFVTPLGYHNLTATNGTSISTDDIQFTGVSVKYEDNSAHYPNTLNWNYYAFSIEDNPFVVDNEALIASTVYDKIKSLKFRPFSCSSIQDPTIEAGDCALVYDVKGNMYNTIITNVLFKTGGYTELDCTAEPPAKQGSRYSAPQSVIRVANSMTTYQSQQAHFNEIASEALGYFKTEEVDAQTGATITYLHDQPTLESSTNVVKIANGIVAISDDGGITYNKGVDTSTGTMLLNLIYVHGLTSDWINTGQLTVGGVDNADGIIHVVNEKLYADGTWDGTGHTGGSWWTYYQVAYQWLKPAGTYKVTKIVIDDVSSAADFVDFKYKLEIKANGETYYRKIQEGPLNIGENIINYVFEITETDDFTYNIVVGKESVVSTDPTFSYHFYTTSVNTIIDKDGVEIRRGTIKLNGKNSYNTSAYGVYMGSDGISFGLYYDNHSDFEVNASTGQMFARKGQIGCYTINSVDGLLYNKSDNFCEYSYYKMHIGGLWNNSYWTFVGIANKGEFLHLDYGQSNVGGIWITKNGQNDMWDFSGNTMKITADNISSSVNGNPVWTGSDRKLKRNIEDLTIEESKDLIYNVQPRKFEFKSKPDKKRYGFIAQEVKEILPKNSDIEYEDENFDLCCIQYMDFIAPLCMIVKEQQAEIDDLKERIKALEDIVKTKLG